MATLDRVLVIGGGIGGLSAAIALRKVGFEVDVFEQAPELREAGAGVGLWANAMASLDALGVGAAVRAGCVPLRIFGGARPDGRVLSEFHVDALGPEFVGAACHVAHRRALLATLAAALPPERVHTDHRAVSVERVGDRARVCFASGRVEEAALLVGADGIHSAIRPAVVGVDETRYSGQTCFRGVAPLAVGPNPALREIQGRGERGAVCPIDANTVYWWVAFNAPQGRVVALGQRKETLLARYRGWPHRLEEAIEATPEESILQGDLIDRAPASRYVDGPIALLGDAAHPTTPNLGQGANMAIDDAVVLARALRDEGTGAAALARYERERLRRTRRIVERSWAFGQACLWTSPLAVAARELALRATPPWAMRGTLREQILEGVGPL